MGSMRRFIVFLTPAGPWPGRRLSCIGCLRALAGMPGVLFTVCLATLAGCSSAPAAVLWTDLGATLVRNSGPGSDIVLGAVRRNDSDSDTLYFKFHLDPLSDSNTEEYFAAFQLFENGKERLGVGNSLKAWGYSAFNTDNSGEFNRVFGDIDLRSARPESSSPGVFLPYELPRRGIESTIVFKVRYVPGGNDLVTAWLNPDLGPGATEAGQPENLTTRFNANASFDEIRLRHGGGGGGWTFSDMAIATSFQDFVQGANNEPGSLARSPMPFAIRSWQREQGLPHNSVYALAQTRDGYLWAGGDDGLTRFDGVRFISLGLREGLLSGRVRVLFEDSEGVLWIGTLGGGLARREGDRVTTLTTKDGLPSDTITALAEDSEQRLWVGTENGLTRLQGGRVAPPAMPTELRDKLIATLCRDRHGVIWVGATGAGLFQCQAGRFQRVQEPTIDSLLQDPHSVFEDRMGRVWVGAGDDFVLCHEEDQWRRYRLPRHVARPYVTALVEQPDGSVWAGSLSEGLFQFKEGRINPVNASSGLSDNFVEALLVDREGNLWVGTHAGLNRLRRKDLATYSQNEGLAYGAVHGLVEVSPGVVWAAKPGDGLYRFDGRRFSRMADIELFDRPAELASLLRTHDGACWAGGTRGLLRFHTVGDTATTTGQSALSGSHVLALAEHAAGDLWAGTREGELWRLRENVWTRCAALTPPHPIPALASDGTDSLWIGTDGGGLRRYEAQGTGISEPHTGLLSPWIRTLYMDKENTLWIGTAGGGLGRWRGGRIANYTTREGLPDNTVSQILEDERGRLWLGSDRGIASVNKRDLEEISAGRLSRVSPQLYGRTEGMLSEECTGGFSPAGLKSSSGELWFSTLKGVVVLDPRPSRTPPAPPPVVLEEVLVDGVVVDRPAGVGSATPFRSGSMPAQTDVPATSDLTIPPGTHRLEIHYTGLSFSAPERLRFRYQLVGLDSDWVEAGSQRTAFYGYVPPGEYSFRVTSCNGEGPWNQEAATLRLTVHPHWWQKAWFLGLAAASLLACVGSGVRLFEKRRLSHRLARLEQERSLERERARIAQDLHDDLGSSLTRISLLCDQIKAEPGSSAQVGTHANRISSSAAQTVRALEEIVWALRPGSDSLQSLVEYIAHFANELFEGDKARCRLDLPHDLPTRPLPPEMRHNVFLIVKEALTNALKHAEACEVRVQMKVSGTTLEVIVQDNGQGFDPAKPLGPAGHNGLGNMRRRAEAMGAELRINSAPGQGTRIKLTVELPEASPP